MATPLDVALRNFKMENPSLEQRIKDFTNVIKAVRGIPSNERPSVDQYDEQLIEWLSMFATVQTEPYVHRDFECASYWIFSDMGHLDFSNDLAFDILIITGYYDVHVNRNLLTSRFAPYKDGDLQEEIALLSKSIDPYMLTRVNLTKQMSFCIDPENAEELDDALSVKLLADGRIKVWIHIVDPTSFIKFDSIIDREARRRGATVYLPRTTSYMYPQAVGMGMMSLKHDVVCRAVSMSVVLNKDGTFILKECAIERSYIKPSCVTYNFVDDHLQLPSHGSGVTEELRLLSLASKQRQALRNVVTSRYDNRDSKQPFNQEFKYFKINVESAEIEEPSIGIEPVGDCNGEANEMVSVFMILCGEVIARFAHDKCIPFIYRAAFDYYTTYFDERDDMGLQSAYVHFTSPLRRYSDVIEHYQIISMIEGGELFSIDQLDELINEFRCETLARTLVNDTKRYWVIEVFTRALVQGETFIAKILQVKTKKKYYCPLEMSLNVKIQYNRLTIYRTVELFDKQSVVRFNEGEVVILEVREAVPAKKKLSFKLSNSQ